MPYSFYYLRGALGDEFISLFGAGTCGDINHIDVSSRGRRSASEIGSMLGATIAQTIPELTVVPEPSLAAGSTLIHVPLQTFTPREIAEAHQNMLRFGSRQLPFRDRVRAYKIMAVNMRPGETLPIEIQAFRLSPDVVIVTLPGEVFVELGVAIKAGSPFATTLVVELANDAPGYLPTRKAFAEGSYETVNSRIQSGGGEKMVTAAVALLHKLHSDGTARTDE